MIAAEHRLQTIVAAWLNEASTRTAYDLPALPDVPAHVARTDTFVPPAPYLSVEVDREVTGHSALANVTVTIECIIDVEITTQEDAASHVTAARRALLDHVAFGAFAAARPDEEITGWNMQHITPRAAADDNLDADMARLARRTQVEVLLHVARGL